MQYTEAKQGRIFVLRLENNEVLHTTIETFAKEHAIQRAAVLFLGAAQKQSRMVSGPQDEAQRPIPVIINVLDNISEACGAGTLFPDTAGQPILHMHATFGHREKVLTGCVRAGVNIWHVGEVIIFELLTADGVRTPDSNTGFDLVTFKDNFNNE